MVKLLLPGWFRCSARNTSPLGIGCPSLRWAHSLAMLLVFSAFMLRASELLAFDLEILPPIPDGPRAYHRAVFDPVQGRFILYSGVRVAQGAPEGVANLWVFEAADSAWIQYDSGAFGPLYRNRYSFAADVERRRAYLFGGNTALGCAEDMWLLSLDSLEFSPIQYVGIGPVDKTQAGFAIDALSGNPWVFFGDCRSTQPPASYFEFRRNTAEWQRWVLTTLDPFARASHALVYDALRRRFVMWGGYASIAARTHDEGLVSQAAVGQWPSLEDVWSFDPASLSWTMLADSSGPGHRAGFVSFYDCIDDALVVYGGRGLLTFSALGDLWSFRFKDNRWSELTSGTSQLPSRMEAGGAFDPCTGSLYVAGGQDSLVLGPGAGFDHYRADAFRVRLYRDACFRWAERPSEMGSGPARGLLTLPNDIRDIPLPTLDEIRLVDCHRGLLLQTASEIRAVAPGRWEVAFPQWTSAEEGGLRAGSLRVASAPRSGESVIAPAILIGSCWQPPSGHSPSNVRVIRSAGSWSFIVQTVAAESEIRLEIFNVIGRRVWAQSQTGTPTCDGMGIDWDGTGPNGAVVVPGVYFARVSYGDQRETVRVVIPGP